MRPVREAMTLDDLDAVGRDATRHAKPEDIHPGARRQGGEKEIVRFRESSLSPVLGRLISSHHVFGEARVHTSATGKCHMNVHLSSLERKPRVPGRTTGCAFASSMRLRSSKARASAVRTRSRPIPAWSGMADAAPRAFGSRTDAGRRSFCEACRPSAIGA
jgi:hypothetical protein